MTEELRVPPHSIDAEQSVLGCIIQDSEAFDQVHTLNPNAFYRNTHQVIFRSIAGMLQEGKQLDVITLAEQLEADKKLEDVGGIAYLGDLAQSSGSIANIKRYAEIVQEKSMLRELIAAVHNIGEEAYSHGDVNAKLDRAQAKIMAITERTQSSEPRFVRDLLTDRCDHIDALFNEEFKATSTGLADLDEKLGGGVLGGQLILIAGRPAMGKSALAVQMAREIQTDEAAGVVFSCEMPNAQIVDRLISSTGRINSNKLRTGKLEDDDWANLTTAIGRLSQLNLLVDDQADTVASITAKARSIKRKYGLSVIVVDYLQLLQGVGEIREQQIASISRGLKRLAIELDVPVIALSQLNRNVDNRPNKRPGMSDLRESGALEQDADVIIFIYRDEVYNPDSEYKGTAELIIGKQREGETGTVRTTFIGSYTSFENFEGRDFEAKPPKEAKPRGFDYA